MVQQIEGALFRNERVEYFYIVNPSICNFDKGKIIAPEIQERMQFDGTLLFRECDQGISNMLRYLGDFLEKFVEQNPCKGFDPDRIERITFEIFSLQL